MLINLRNALMAGRRLPYDAELEYLESTGTQYIDTGVDVYGATDIGFDVLFSPTNAAQEQRVISTEGSSPTYDVYFASATQINLRQGGYSATVANGDLIQCEYKNGIWKVYINGSLALTKSKAFSAVANSKNVYLMVRANNFSSSYRFQGKVFSVKIWISGTIVRDYIPVRVGSGASAVGYLYDRVSGKLFGNAGTGDFVLGQDVVPVEYIESHGTEYIDTGVVGGSSSKVEIVASSSNTVQNMGLFGSRNASFVKAFTIWQRVTNTSVRFDFAGDTTNRVIANAAWDTSGVNTVIKDGPNNTLNGVAGQNNNTATFTCEYPFYIFSINTAGTATANASARVYSCKIWQNGVLVRDYKAIRVGTGSTWEGAMMDVLTRRVYRNAGTGAFIYGNDLKYPIPAS